MRTAQYGNMRRHIKKLHPDEYKNGSRNISCFQLDRTKKRIERENDDEVTSGSNSEPEITDEQSEIGIENIDLEKKIMDLCKKPVLLNKRNRTTCMWNFFNKIEDDNTYICMLCSQCLRVEGRNFSNLRRHFSSRHPEAYKMILKHAPLDDSLRASITKRNPVQIITEKSRKLSDETIETIKDLCSKLIRGKHRYKTCLWNFFSQISPELYRCTFCNRKITTTEKHVHNLRRHMKTIHVKEYEEIVKYAPEKDSVRRAGTFTYVDNAVLSSLAAAPPAPVGFDKAYFDEIDEGMYRCKECDENIGCSNDDQSSLFSHIQEKHPDQVVMYQEQTTSNEDFSVFIVKK